jgi:putative chitinase
MMTPIAPAQLKLLAPNARSAYLAAFASADTVLAGHGINSTPLRLAHFMAQVLHECGGLTIQVENLNYRAERLMQVWPSRFPTLASAQPFAHNPQGLADNVYGGRMGNVAPHDGSKFIGRGLLQLTGRESYRRIGERIGAPLEAQPDLAFDGAWALKVAAEEWTVSGCNVLADADDLKKVTKAINGGLIGLASRQDWLIKTRHVWP